MRLVSIIIFVFLIHSTTIAQNYNSLNNNNDFARDILFIEQVGSNSRGVSLVENRVFLHQIGERNLSNLFIDANTSEVDIFQKGNDNEVELKVSANKVVENIVQIGDNNYFQDISLLRFNSPRAIDVYQNGTDQQILIRGSNQLSEKMKIMQKGNDRVLIINNFN